MGELDGDVNLESRNLLDTIGAPLPPKQILKPVEMGENPIIDYLGDSSGKSPRIAQSAPTHRVRLVEYEKPQVAPAIVEDKNRRKLSFRVLDKPTVPLKDNQDQLKKFLARRATEPSLGGIPRMSTLAEKHFKELSERPRTSIPHPKAEGSSHKKLWGVQVKERPLSSAPTFGRPSKIPRPASSATYRKITPGKIILQPLAVKMGWNTLDGNFY